MEHIKESVRPYYEELKGRLAQLPSPDEINKNRLGDFTCAFQFNQVISELNEITNENFNRFCFPPEILSPGAYPIPDTLSLLRMNMNGLIGSLFAKFFSDLPEPFSGPPPAVNVLTNRQEQTVKVDFIFDLQNFLDGRLKEFQKNSPERNFIEKLKDGLSNTKNVVDVISTVVALANKYKITDKLASIFS